MEQFKINNEVKTNISREAKTVIKANLKNGGYSEIAIMYDPVDEYFFTASSFDIAALQYAGQCLYKELVNYEGDKITIDNLKERIFN